MVFVLQNFHQRFFGKLKGRPRPSTSIASVVGPFTKSSLSVRDELSKRHHLVDSGADISALPASPSTKLTKPTGFLSAANKSLIRVWGIKHVVLKLGGRRFHHSFFIADVAKPILGADFFVRHNLAIDLNGRRLIDMANSKVLLSLFQSPSASLPLVFGLSSQENNKYSTLLQEFPDILVPRFHSDVNKHGIEHHIITSGPPVHSKARRLDAEKLAVAKQEFVNMEKLGVSRRSDSPWSSPLHVVAKADGGWRPCGDYRRLNNATVDDRYPLPHIHDFNAHLAGAKVFSKVDLMRGYHQIPMAKESIPKTAIVTPFGLFEFTRMPFGLKNAAQGFQRLMDKIFQGITFVFVYLDDILVASRSEQEHIGHLRQVFQILSDNGLVVKKEKCVFGVQELDYLGHRVTTDGVKPLPQRVEAMQKYPCPSDKAALTKFIGVINYYHRCLPHIAQTLAPLHAATCGKGKNITWTPECQTAFDKAKSALSKATLLAHPHPHATTSITVDASGTAVGGQLEQRFGTKWRPIAFFSKKLSDAERKYSAFDRELLALYMAIKHFRHFLEGRPFTVFTDHKPLTTAIDSLTDRSPRQTRHLSFIAEFTSDIQHIAGKNNIVADALSRVHAIAVPTIDYQALAADQRSHEVQAYRSAITNLQLQDVPFGQTTVLCDVSTGKPRPVVPSSWTRRVFDLLHGLSHAGFKPTRKAIGERFVWHGMNKEIHQWCQECHPCQASKIHRHTRAPLVDRILPKARFNSIHVDLVGPLPASEGMVYMFTIVDRFTRWPEAIPLPDAKTTTVIKAFLRCWMSTFGVPADITSDRGPQFTSELWGELHRMLGIKANTTTAYHPQANGMVERFHRQLKSSLEARCNNPQWMDELPFVLLGIRSARREDLGCSPAELVYGTTLAVPGEFISQEPRQQQPTADYLRTLQSYMRRTLPTPPSRHGNRPSHVPANLNSTGFVYLRRDATAKPLTQPYTGPFKVIEARDKYFIIDHNGRTDKVSVDRLKVAYVPSSQQTDTRNTQSNNQSSPTLPSQSTPLPTPGVVTRFGRTVRLPPRFRNHQ